MLRFPEVYTDLRFVLICTIPLELCVATKINVDAETNDNGFFVTCIQDQVCSKEELPNWSQHSANESFVINYLQQSGLSVDKVTQFSLRPPELRSSIDMIGNYYRWFYIIIDKRLKLEQINMGIKNDLKETL